MIARADLLIRGARLVSVPGRGPEPADIVVAGGRIAAVAPEGGGFIDATEVVDASGLLCAPGWVNGHLHSHELLFRGRAERMCLEEWMTAVRPLPSLPLTAADVRDRTLAVAAEAIRSGTTTLCDDVGLDPVGEPALLDAVADAYAEAGVRAFVGPTLFDVPFARAVALLDGLPPAPPVRPAADQLAAARAFAERLLARGGLVRPLVAPSAPQRCSDGLLRGAASLARDLGLPLLTHVLETRTQAAGSHLAGGYVRRLAALGVLGPLTTLVHGVWLSAEDRALVAAAGATVQANPWSNLKLGSGVADLRALLDAGVNVALGSDGCGSAETMSPAAAVAAAALLSTLRNEPGRWLAAAEAFEAGTLGGACALGLGDALGLIAPGRRADLALYRLDRPPFVPLSDPVRQLVFGVATAALDTVVVEGRVLMRGGRVVTVDESALAARVEALRDRLAEQIEEAERAAAGLRPAMARARARALAMDLPDTPPALLGGDLP